MRSSTENLGEFVRESLSRGVSKVEIKRVLLQAGWSQNYADGAINCYADIDFPLPVPRPTVQLSAKEAFVYLVIFVALYLSAFHLGSLVFHLIDKTFPDPIAPVVYSFYDPDSSMRWSISWLIVSLPLFFFMAARNDNEVVKDPMKRLSPVRRWLTYMTLFTASFCLLGDIATLFYKVLGGEAKISFLLKVLTVALIAGTAFVHYLKDLKKEEKGAI